MTKYLLFLLPLWAFSNEISISHAQMKPLGKIVKTNAQITQLSDQKQEIVSRLPGHVEHYFVTTGQEVKEGEKVVLIESIALSKMSAEYVALRQQGNASKEQLGATKKLYKKGLASQNELNQKIIALEKILAKQNALVSQLESLGIKASNLKEATDKFVLYAHSSGVVGEIFVPLHSNVNAQAPLMSIVNRSHYYAMAYMRVDDAMKITPKTTGFVTIANKQYPVRFVQLLPNIDEATQRAKVLFMMMKYPKNTLIHAFTQIDISLEPYQNAVMIKKSALSLFQGEWVVFVETHENEKKSNDEAEEEVPYAPKVVQVIAYNGDEVAIKGLKENEAYVSDGVYYVKSMLLKSAIGDGD